MYVHGKLEDARSTGRLGSWLIYGHQDLFPVGWILTGGSMALLEMVGGRNCYLFSWSGQNQKMLCELTLWSDAFLCKGLQCTEWAVHLVLNNHPFSKPVPQPVQRNPAAQVPRLVTNSLLCNFLAIRDGRNVDSWGNTAFGYGAIWLINWLGERSWDTHCAKD